jgi:hypothetical protein
LFSLSFFQIGAFDLHCGNHHHHAHHLAPSFGVYQPSSYTSLNDKG